MTSSEIKIIDQTIDHDHLEEGSIAVAKEIMCGWKDQDVKYKVLQGGYGNETGCCYLSSDINLDKAVVVRTYGFLSDTLVERDREVRVMQVIGTVGCCQPMYGMFNNGHVYGFAQGKTLLFDDFNNPGIIRKLCTMIAKVNNIDTDSVEVLDRKGNRAIFPKTTGKTIHAAAMGMVSHIPETYDDPAIQKLFDDVFRSRESMKNEMREMLDFLESLDIPFCLVHGDVQPRNIIYNEKTGDFNFVDFETTSYNRRCTDMSSLFGMKAIFDLVGMSTKGEPDISMETQKLWMKCYLEATYDIKGKNKSMITEDDIDELYTEYYMCGIVDKLFLSVFLVAQFPSGVDNINNLRLSEPLMKYYLDRKGHLFGLKQKLEAYRQAKKKT